MVDKYLATEMFKFNALSQFSIASFIFIYRGGWPCDLYIYIYIFIRHKAAITYKQTHRSTQTDR